MNDFFAYKFSEGAFRMFNIMLTRSLLVNEPMNSLVVMQGNKAGFRQVNSTSLSLPCKLRDVVKGLESTFGAVSESNQKPLNSGHDFWNRATGLPAHRAIHHHRAVSSGALGGGLAVLGALEGKKVKVGTKINELAFYHRASVLEMRCLPTRRRLIVGLTSLSVTREILNSHGGECVLIKTLRLRCCKSGVWHLRHSKTINHNLNCSGSLALRRTWNFSHPFSSDLWTRPNLPFLRVISSHW